ncbi:acyl-CoA dehydrogenase family protein [Rhodococcus sp. T2V]|uniref:acyl-CoA dehydrogenase family protein n=1 Tax=Rhodococcus sp. T2V TaxID=3034164 RepID=UPI0023E25C94|nr:acyl-CoA dehydrogenase family protein [Rhodococcus sp. T2V]MDF3310066.1 acyl-CoA dehydrogenase family protein [Rhodococcus sp. T2V]
MDAAAEQYRAEIRTWLTERSPQGWRETVQAKDEAGVVEYYRDWTRRLHGAGHLVPHWPIEFGGRGLGVAGQVVQQQELSFADAPRPRPMAISLGHAAATLMEHGDAEQKKLVAAILDGEIFCQGFSEPGAGSDLAALRCRAERDGDRYIVSGQKTWSSFARYASWCLLLARTDVDAPKHRGISFFLVDMRSPGITVRPIKQATGSAEFCEIFFDDVEVPASMRIGAEGEGWRIAQTTLTNERALQLIEITSALRSSYDRLVATTAAPAVGGTALLDDPALRQRFAEVGLTMEVLKALSEQSLTRVARFDDIGPLSSVLKISLSKALQDFTRLASETEGVAGLTDPGEPREVGYVSGRHFTDHVRSWTWTIAAGTNEIQRNIIAERVLGLPREPRA